MKKIILIIIILFIYNFSFGQGKVETVINKNFAVKNTLEIAGTISFSSIFDDDSSLVNFDLTPSLSYFVIDNFHIGYKQLFGYNLYKLKSSNNYNTTYSFGPFISLGYTFELTKMLFIDLSPELGYYTIFPFGDLSATFHYMYYGLVTSLKVNTGNGMVNVKLQYHYKSRVSEDGPESNHQLSLGVGYSIFFNL